MNLLFSNDLYYAPLFPLVFVKLKKGIAWVYSGIPLSRASEKNTQYQIVELEIQGRKNG